MTGHTLDGLDFDGVVALQVEIEELLAEIAALRAERDEARTAAGVTIDWTPEINRLRNEVVPAIEAERDEATAQLGEQQSLLAALVSVLKVHATAVDNPNLVAALDALPARARDMLEVVDAAVKMYEECPPDSPRSVTEWRGYWRELGAAVAHYNAIRGEQ